MNIYVQCSRFVTLTQVRYKKCKYSQEKGVFSEERRGNICYCVYVQSDGYVDEIICILMCGHDCGEFSPPSSAVGKDTMMATDMLLLV